MKDSYRQNHIHVWDNSYICYTQAGFRQSIKHLCKRHEEDFQVVKKNLQGYPTSHPCFIEFHNFYTGYYYWKVYVKTIDKVLEDLHLKIKILNEEKGRHQKIFGTNNGNN